MLSDRLWHMSDAYKDLDALVPDDTHVKLGGVQYTLPGDLPLEIYVRVNKASELEAEDEEAAVSQVVSAMVDLFAWLYQDKPEESRIRTDVEKTLRSRGIRFNTRLLQNIYGNDINDAEVSAEVAAGPTN
jgi:hypothetical protein